MQQGNQWGDVGAYHIQDRMPGVGAYELVGAQRRHPARHARGHHPQHHHEPQQHGGQHPQEHKSPHGEVMEEPHGKFIYVQWSPLPVTIIVSPATTGSAVWRPQRIFRAQKLIIASSMESTTTASVSAFNIGATPQFVNDGNVPIIAFQNTTVGTIFRGDTCNPGIDITVAFGTAGAVAPGEMLQGVLLGSSVNP
jgi:hypothetical protein